MGLGTRVASIQTLFAEGAEISTGISTDISIQGNGFLIAKNGNQTYLTRAGNLTFDSNGFLVDQNGGLIQGLDATLQYSTQTLNTISNVPGQPLVITSADLSLNSANVSGLTNIQINRDMTIPPKATTEVEFKGNLDSFQQPDVFNLYAAAGPVLPVGLMLNQIPSPAGIDATRMTTVPVAGGGFALAQVSNLSQPVAGTTIPVPLVNGIITLADVVQNDTGVYAWEKQPPLPPAATSTETVYDSLGNPRQITVLFYQVNDLGSNGVNNPAGPNQACYAWYAFDTTGGKVPSPPPILLGGTAIIEGDMVNPPFDFLAVMTREFPLPVLLVIFFGSIRTGPSPPAGELRGPPRRREIQISWTCRLFIFRPTTHFPRLRPSQPKGRKSRRFN